MDQDVRQAAFDKFIRDNEEDLKVVTAQAMAVDLGLWFRPDYYDPENQIDFTEYEKAVSDEDQPAS